MAKSNLLLISIVLIGCGVNSLQNNYQQEINHPYDLLEHVVKRLTESKGTNMVEKVDISYQTVRINLFYTYISYFEEFQPSYSMPYLVLCLAQLR